MIEELLNIVHLLEVNGTWLVSIFRTDAGGVIFRVGRFVAFRFHTIFA
jgi:hypothetical protein